MSLNFSNIFITHQLRKKFIYNDSTTFLNKIFFGFLAFNNNLTTKELDLLSNYLSLFGFFIKKIPASLLTKTFQGSDMKLLKGNILILYTKNFKNLCKFPIVSFYTLNKLRLPIFSVLFGTNLVSLQFFYKEVVNKLTFSKKLLNNIFIFKFNIFVRFFRALQVLFFKSLYLKK